MNSTWEGTKYDRLRRILGLEVIELARVDASGSPPTAETAREVRELTMRARSWLTNRSYGLEIICAIAEVDMERLLDIYRRKYDIVRFDPASKEWRVFRAYRREDKI